MDLIKPFRGLRPALGRGAEVIAPPYDVLNSAEARERAQGKPWSFLHISKPEIDLPEDTDPYSAEVYAKAAANLQATIAAGLLVRDEQPCYYAYRLIMGEHRQTGLVAGASVADYDTNRIRKHEFTRPVKEDDRVRQIDAVNAQTGPVLLAYPDSPSVDRILAETTQGEPVLDVTADDGIQHTLWVISDADTLAQLTAAFNVMHALYIADGHHRSAAASRIAKMRNNQQGSDYFLSVIFPAHEMKILDYNRVIKDLHDMQPAQFLAAVEQHFALEPANAPVKPERPGVFGMYLDGHWFKLTLNPELMPNDDPVARLDVSRVARYLIE
ncbi:MAG: DUF1015 domain-containing protein, partial [Thiothrix sp.]